MGSNCATLGNQEYTTSVTKLPKKGESTNSKKELTVSCAPSTSGEVAGPLCLSIGGLFHSLTFNRIRNGDDPSSMQTLLSEVKIASQLRRQRIAACGRKTQAILSAAITHRGGSKYQPSPASANEKTVDDDQRSMMTERNLELEWIGEKSTRHVASLVAWRV